jgi:secreted trypsin-like serine protease
MTKAKASWSHNGPPRAALRGAFSLALAIVFLPVGSALTWAENFECIDPVTKQHVFKVYGGIDATPSDWPFLVAIFSAREPRPFCGGSLVNQQWVLTAAHCAYRNQLGPPLRGADTLNVHRSTAAGEPKGPGMPVAKVIAHPQYNGRAQQNDVALLRLRAPLDLESSKLAMLATPHSESIWGRSGVCAAAAGWGLGARANAPLQAVNIPVVEQQECRDALSPTFDIQPGPHICAGYMSGGADACRGDSGGPLIVRAGPTGYLLIGVVSFGRACALPRSPGVYARVSAYRDWIVATINGNP